MNTQCPGLGALSVYSGPTSEPGPDGPGERSVQAGPGGSFAGV